MMHFAAVAFCILSGLVILFQIALVFGAPWGEWTLGGKWRGRLPLKVRLIPCVSTIIILFFISVVLARSGIAMHEFAEFANKGIWIVVVYCGVGMVANSATPSPRERRLWVPILVLMLLSCLTVALL